ncbi:hypothetical protein LV779_36690 [Streptomyces thinghirensis]|nr:hypothetical protein [Streptomyces thinghirensis]
MGKGRVEACGTPSSWGAPWSRAWNATQPEDTQPDKGGSGRNAAPSHSVAGDSRSAACGAMRLVDDTGSALRRPARWPTLAPAARQPAYCTELTLDELQAAWRGGRGRGHP